ncbi:MAG: multifunctional CCA addition/repair protein [Legionellales bacterium]|nr:MAG: multifunctional CCA addition/repair protein [Legionellales bacterium]
MLNCYLVGGAVRDKLLNIEVEDHDWVVVGSTAATMLDRGFKQVGKNFPVFLHPKTKEEYALARTERKTAPGYHGFACISDPSVTLEDDLLRRDLTINAMAEDPDGNIIDPHNGQVDLKNKILRHVSEAFTEDPVRVLRIARFAARLEPYNFTIAPETMLLMQQMVQNGELNHLVPERVWQELAKSLTTTSPRTFIEVLRECGALEILLPEIAALWGVPQNPKWHPEIDTGVHVMLALDMATQLTSDPVTRFAVLCHDLGKALTPKDILPAHHGHEQRGVAPIKQLSSRLNIPKAYRDLAIKVAKLHLLSHTILDLKASTILKLLEQLDAFRNPELVEKFAIACTADARGRSGLKDTTYAQADILRSIFIAVKKISAKPLFAAGLRDNILKNTLDKLRITAINTVTNHYNG